MTAKGTQKGKKFLFACNTQKGKKFLFACYARRYPPTGGI